MLDTTRASTFVPGSNRIDAASGAAWLALLPAQDPGRVLVLGFPGTPVLRTLARAAGSLTVRCRTAAQARRARRVLAGTGARVEPGGGSGGEGGFDLVVTQGPSDAPPERLLRPGGAVVTLGAIRGSAGGGGVVFRPAFGEVTAAVPRTAPNARRALEGRGLWSGAVVLRALGRSHEVAGAWTRALPDRGMTIGTDGPPAWLQRIAGEAGVDLGGYDWAMAAPGRYRSNKILFFLFERGSDEPRFVVKATRDGELNGRLEVERDALDRLHSTNAVSSSTIPSVAFSGIEAGRAVLGLTAVHGRPFTSVTQASEHCPHAARAFEWLTGLGSATATPVAGAELAAHLGDILERFLGMYDVGAPYRVVLEEQIGIIERTPTFPAVFQHGDPGAWNLLVAGDGSVAFLDWEAAEHRGVPLWDVFHLARSYAVVAARAAGEHNMMRAIDRHLLGESPLNAMFADVVSRYRTAVGVPAELVEPLFHTSWMHRALKEATRLPEARLGESHYLALLRRGIDGRRSPGVERVLAAGRN
jgi:phosphotransferase family enzyme